MIPCRVSITRVCRMAAAALFILTFLPLMLPAETIIRVRDFGAVPGDGKSDLAAIVSAMERLKGRGEKVLLFEAGTYHLEGDGTDLGKKQALLYFSGLEQVELRGQRHPDGRPATRLERRWKPANDISPPTVLYVDRCTNFSVRDLELGNDPPVSTIGRIVRVDPAKDEVVVDMLPGMAAFDGMRSASAQLWDLGRGALVAMGPTPKDATLNWGLNPRQYWKARPDLGATFYSAEGHGYAAKAKVGQGLSWFFDNAQKNNQTWIMYSQNVRFENLLFRNVSTMGLLAGYNRDLTMRKVVFRPENGNLAVGSRDGMHFSMTSGRLLVEDCTFFGLRMDPLVIRKTFGIVEERTGPTEIKVKPAFPCPDGSKIRFWVGDAPRDITIRASRSAGEGVSVYTMAEALPDEVKPGTAVTFQAYALDEAVIRRCTFEENLGSPVVNFEENLVVEHSVFRHNSYQLKFGANEVTGAFARNVVVRSNVFCDPGWVDIAGRNAPACLTIHSLSKYFEAPRYNQGIAILNNLFSNSTAVPEAVAVHVLHAEDVTFRDNRFVGFQEAVRVDPTTTRRIHREESGIK